VVIVFSDHGDWAGDYGIVEKWPSGLDDALTRVPFVVRLPGGAMGHTVGAVTELLDLTSTVLDLAGIPLAHTQFGRSLVPQLHGAAGDSQRAAFAEGGYDSNEPHAFEGKPGRDQFARAPTHIYWPKGDLQQRDPLSVCRATMIRTTTHKLVRRPLEVSELYDLVDDPQELQNRYDEPGYAAVQNALERRLLDWYVHTSDVTPLQEDPRGQTAPLMGRAQVTKAGVTAIPGTAATEPEAVTTPSVEGPSAASGRWHRNGNGHQPGSRRQSRHCPAPGRGERFHDFAHCDTQPSHNGRHGRHA